MTSKDIVLKAIAGNDPAYTTALGTATTSSWDGTLNNGMPAGSGTYYWGTWQKRGVWTSQRAPPNRPIAVLVALTMTTSSTSELLA